MKDVVLESFTINYYLDKWEKINLKTDFKSQIIFDNNKINGKISWENFRECDSEIFCMSMEVSGVKAFWINYNLKNDFSCLYKPHLSPKENMVIGDKAFRSPVMIFDNGETSFFVVPDLGTINKNRVVPNIMDYKIDDNSFLYGICNYEEVGHVYYKIKPELTENIIENQNVKLYFVKNKSEGRNFKKAEEFLWKTFSNEFMNNSRFELKAIDELKVYPKYAYKFALDNWAGVTWQQFKIKNVEVGGISFLVRAKQKPGYGNEENWREPKSIWNQAWFSSLRSAYGYYNWGLKMGREDYMLKAKLALEFALSAEQVNGLFPCYYEAGQDNKWESGRWFMSAPRRPKDHENYVHLLDCSWTAIWLLKWYRDIERNLRILQYVKNYINTLVSLIDENGAFPAWIDPENLKKSKFLYNSPEHSMHISLLILYMQITGENNFIKICENTGNFVAENVLPDGRWEDFETYWSCSKEWEHKQYGIKDNASGIYSQCNFGMYWTAQAYLDLYRCTNDKKWLDLGEIVLAELSLYQQIWQPVFMSVNVIGGFGVMNSDDEWNDARQSLFALTYLDYYNVTKIEKYKIRALWSMQASFYMMYCPENVVVKSLYEKVHSNFNEFDYGFHMENFNHHDGTVSKEGLGEFTIFDWGCGAASTSLLEFLNKLEE